MCYCLFTVVRVCSSLSYRMIIRFLRFLRSLVFVDFPCSCSNPSLGVFVVLCVIPLGVFRRFFLFVFVFVLFVLVFVDVSLSYVSCSSYCQLCSSVFSIVCVSPSLFILVFFVVCVLCVSILFFCVRWIARCVPSVLIVCASVCFLFIRRIALFYLLCVFVFVCVVLFCLRIFVCIVRVRRVRVSSYLLFPMLSLLLLLCVDIVGIVRLVVSWVVSSRSVSFFVCYCFVFFACRIVFFCVLF